MEPITVLTDLILTIICLYFFFRLSNKKLKVETRFWKYFFLWISLSTLLGAIAHGLFYYIEGNIHLAVWLLMQVFSGLAVYFAENSTIRYFFSQPRQNALLKIVTTKLLIMLLATFYFQNYSVVIINTAIGFLTILYFKTRHFLNGNSASGFIAGGIILAIFTAVVHGLKWSLSDWFNHNDISHVIMMFSLWSIFLGVVKIQDQ